MSNDIIELNTVEQLSDTFGLPAPSHPLIALYSQRALNYKVPAGGNVRMGLYAIILKDEQDCKMQYGWREYDFSKGVMNFISPGQVVSFPAEAPKTGTFNKEGWLLVFHSDLIRKYPLGAGISRFHFFDYQTTEALHASEAERLTLNGIFSNIAGELSHPIDEFSQDIIVSQIQALLNYSERFYKRQFQTRLYVEDEVVVRFEETLKTRLNAMESNDFNTSLTPAMLASDMHMSNHYLSDCMRNATGMTTQQHIHSALMDKAKQLLLGTSLSSKEIAYKLGFEYPQYFARLFKNKTGITPSEYRKTGMA